MNHGPPTVRPADVGMLMHMLGIDGTRPREQWGFRNYYAAEPKGSSHDALKRMETAGLARFKGFDGSCVYYAATREGCFLAGMTMDEIDKMEARP